MKARAAATGLMLLTKACLLSVPDENSAAKGAGSRLSNRTTGWCPRSADAVSAA